VTLSIPEFHAARCVRYRFRYSECQRCHDACPHGAVGLSDEGVCVDPARCANCALCTSACRTGALVPDNLPRIELLKRAVKRKNFVFACTPSGAQGDAMVPCLGALDPTMLGYLAKRDIAVELRGSHHCAHCQHGDKGAAQLALNLEVLGALRQAAAPEAWAGTALATPPAPERQKRAEDFLAGRRQLFRRFIGQGIDELAHAAAATEATPVPAKAIRAGSYFLPEHRELLQIIGKTASGGPFQLTPHPALHLLDIRLAEGCSACEACFRVCPTGALQIEESNVAWALTFNPDRCVGCEVCLEVCQPRALLAAELVDASPADGRAVLHSLAKQRCARCDRFFVSPEPREHCDICADDEEAFSAIFG
jgi:ferredoxin